MKLYTEEQVRQMLSKARGDIWYSDNELFATQPPIELPTPIELPSDEEIHKQAINYSGFDNEFEAGAKWMRDKTQ